MGVTQAQAKRFACPCDCWQAATRTGGSCSSVCPPGVYTIRAHGPPSDPRVLSERVTLNNCGADAFFLFNLPPDTPPFPTR
jgi:hypothetical protein